MTSRTASARAYSYARFSTPDQAKGDSLRRQQDAARRYAEAHALDLDERLTFRDLGVSAFRGANRRQGALADFLQAVESGKVKRGSVLLVENLDRLSHEGASTAFVNFTTLLKTGVDVVTLHDGRRYSEASLDADVSDLMVSILQMHRAHDESATKAKRIAAVWANRRTAAQTAGTPMQGPIPAWLRFNTTTGKYEPIPSKAKAVARIFTLAAQGHGEGSIVKTLARERVPAIARRDYWTASYVHKILTSPSVIGTLQPHTITVDRDGTKVRTPAGDALDNYYPAVVPAAIYARVVKLRSKRPSPRGRPSTGQANLFRSLFRCHCGEPMHYVSKGDQRQHGGSCLQCAGARRGTCSYRSWPYPKVERLFLSLCQHVIPWSKLLPSARSAAQDRIAAFTDQLATLDLDRQSNATNLARIVAAIETGVDARTLRDRITALETLKADQDRQALSLRGALESARVELTSAQETIARRREAFDLWKVGKLTDVESRTRLAAVLRELFRSIILATGHHAETGARALKLTIVMADGEASHFICSPALDAVYDDEGELVANV